MGESINRKPEGEIAENTREHSVQQKECSVKQREKSAKQERFVAKQSGKSIKQEARAGKQECMEGQKGNSDLLEQIKSTFGCGKVDVRAYSPLTLAYVGDAIYDLVIRTVVVERANRAANELHKRTVKYVKADVQAAMIEALQEELTEDELAVYKRGRNAKSHTSAKNASIQDYRKATGFEALMGFLYLNGQTERMLYLVRTGIAALEMNI